MPQVSVVVPVHDEEGAAAALAREIADTLQGRAFEMIFVDDASRDGTRAELEAARTALPQLRVLAHGANAGQSRAVRTGVLAARGEIILTLDGDGQNPPGDGPALIDLLLASPAEVALVGGRRARRQDSQAKLWASRWANRIRKRLLGDDADDTGCGLKAFRLSQPLSGRQPPAARPGSVEIHQLEPAEGLGVRPAGRHLAQVAGPPAGWDHRALSPKARLPFRPRWRAGPIRVMQQASGGPVHPGRRGDISCWSPFRCC